MGGKNQPYKLEEKFWVVSEVKASMIEVFNNFVKMRDNYVRSLKPGTIDPRVARGEFTSALYEFYNMMLNGFIPYLEKYDWKDGEKKYSEKDYMELAIKMDHEATDLVGMAYILNKWAFCLGPFRITHQEKVWNSQLDQLEAEDEQ